MFSAKDKQQIEERGSQLETVIKQIENFKTGFPFLHIEKAATVGDGIIKLSDEDIRIKYYCLQRKNSSRNTAGKIYSCIGCSQPNV